MPNTLRILGTDVPLALVESYVASGCKDEILDYVTQQYAAYKVGKAPEQILSLHVWLLSLSEQEGRQ